MKAKPIHPTLADKCAEMLADMRREHPTEPLEWAVFRMITAQDAIDMKAGDDTIEFRHDPNLKLGQCFLRIRWS